MKKLVLCFVFLSILPSYLFAEPYVGMNFPSDEMILKTVSHDLIGHSEVVGKVELNKGYFFIFTRDERRIERHRLTKLDTNFWVIQTSSEVFLLIKK